MPDHERLVRTGCREDLLFHAGSDSRDLLTVEGDSQVRNFSEVVGFLLLNTHLQHLPSLCCVDEIVSYLIHTC